MFVLPVLIRELANPQGLQMMNDLTCRYQCIFPTQLDTAVYFCICCMNVGGPSLVVAFYTLLQTSWTRKFCLFSWFVLDSDLLRRSSYWIWQKLLITQGFTLIVLRQKGIEAWPQNRKTLIYHKKCYYPQHLV